MNEGKINVRYAKALFSLGKERNMLESFMRDIYAVSMVCSQSSEFNYLLESPVIKTSHKKRLLTEIFQGKIDDIALSFLHMITDNKREQFIPGICRNFLDMTKKDQGIKTAVFTSATTLSQALLEEIGKILETEFATKVELTGKTNENLIGGFILSVDDKQYDASVATRLRKIKETFLSTDI